MTLAGLLGSLNKFKDRAVLVGGCTSDALRAHGAKSVWISTAHVKELRVADLSKDALTLGGAVTLAETEVLLQRHLQAGALLPHTILGCLALLLPWVGSTQVRASATWGGAVALGEANSDLLCFLAAARATAVVVNASGRERRIAFATAPHCEPGEVVVSVLVPATTAPMTFCWSAKYGPRKHLARSVVGGTAVVRTSAAGQLQELTVALVGLSRARWIVRTFDAAALSQCRWTLADATGPLLEIVGGALCAIVDGDEQPSQSHTDDSAVYRKQLVQAFLVEFLTRSSELLVDASVPASGAFRSSEWRPLEAASQNLDFGADPSVAPVGVALPHHSAAEQTDGRAKFVADEAAVTHALVCVPVLSQRSHARFHIDDTAARAIDGVVRILYGADCAVNTLDEEGVFLATDQCVYWGQPLALVVAESGAAARQASAALVITYEDLPAVRTLHEAMAAQSTHGGRPVVREVGSVDVVLAQPDVTVVEGEWSLGASEHFYLEPHAALAVPSDSGLVVSATTQSLSVTCNHVAAITGLSHAQIVVQCKRLGGGFGGKGIPWLALPALAAHKTRRPCQMILSRTDDLIISNKRAETIVRWRAGVRAQRIEALDIHVYYGAGAFANSCSMYAQLVTLAGTASYQVPHFRSTTHVLRINRAPTGPLRGAGIPQGVCALETIMDRVAHALRCDPDELRAAHLRDEGSLWLGAPMDNVNERACWDAVRAMARFDERKAAVAAFNAANRWKKRGLAVQANTHPFNWRNSVFLQQSRAVVHVAMDGSVTISHQGIEMGQGVHGKMRQVAAHQLGVPVERVTVATNSTAVLGSTVVDTGGSTGTETNALAVMKACRKIVKRMRKLGALSGLELDPSTFDIIASMQQSARVALSVAASVSTYDPAPCDAIGGFKYYIFGASVVEVELDVLTGAYHFPHASVCADFGKSLNPGIDIGQCEGAFLQSLSWCTREQLHYSAETGALQTTRADKYYLATAYELPRDFHVRLLHNPGNPVNKDVYLVKGTGEPAYNLGVAAFVALQRAVLAARGPEAPPAWLTIPATHEAVRRAIGDVKIAP